MFHIALNRLRVHAPIGLYEEEKILGNEFLVDLIVSCEEGSTPVLSISETIDYGQLTDLVKNRMKEGGDLLETILQDIAEVIHIRFPRVREINISVSKLHAPIPQLEGQVRVTLQRTY